MARKLIVPRSVKPGIPRIEQFPRAWDRAPFGDVLDPAMRPVKLEAKRVYQLVVAKRNRGGIAPREQLRGEQIKTAGQFELKEGDFVIAKRQIIHGACGFVPRSLEGAVVSGEYDVFRVREPLTARFLEWFTHTTYFQQTTYQSSIGVAIEKMIFNTERWLRVLMPLPSAAAQARIAETLDGVHRAEQCSVRLIEAKRRLKRALLQQLLTGTGRAKVRVVALADVVRLRSGNTPSKARPDYWDGDFPWISAKDLKRPRIGESIDRITSLAVKESATVVPPGTVVILVRGMTLLKDVPVAVTTRELAINQDIKGLEPSAEIDSGFLLCTLAVKRSQLMGFVNRAGHGTGKLDTDRLLSLPLHLPPLAEQRKVAAAVEFVDREIALLGSQLAAYRQFKRGLMQKLLTGDVALPTDPSIATQASIGER